jgi:3-dehydroquinate dehydratase/shikimate dehydrogenase
MSVDVEGIGACNTITRGPQGWRGTNTDMRGFSDSLLNFMSGLRAREKERQSDGPKAIDFKALITKSRGSTVSSLRGYRVTVIGAGGAAKAVAAELYRLGAKALLLNRTVIKARTMAGLYKFQWGGLDDRGVEQMEKYSDIIIQTTPAGTEGNPDQDPLEMYAFTGREIVMDLVYNPDRTPFLQRAAAVGCPVLSGYDMLIRQARYQYTQFFKRDFPAALLSRVGF